MTTNFRYFYQMIIIFIIIILLTFIETKKINKIEVKN